MSKTKTLIMGAAGRDFHNFNTFYRDNEQYNVVAFTATQIPDIEGRVYPNQLAGKLYPKGIPIHDESELIWLISQHNVDEVVFSYSDLSQLQVYVHSSNPQGLHTPSLHSFGSQNTTCFPNLVSMGVNEPGNGS